jgi:hypothetical protein
VDCFCDWKISLCFAMFVWSYSQYSQNVRIG